MPARANTRSIRHIMNGVNLEKLNILTFATHERYEENLCKTGHNFYSLRVGKEWDETYAPVPKNYHIIDSVPESLDIDLVLCHTNDRIQVAHDILSATRGMQGQLTCPILRHCHVLPDVRFNTDEQKSNYQSIPVDHNSFISNFNRGQWGFSASNSSVVEHGIDTDFWGESYSNKTMLYKDGRVLSVVNEFPTRDWCCGFNLWREVASDIPCQVVGKCTGEHAGFSQPAESREHLRQLYQTAPVFLNTSLHSPVPTVMMEAMACGTPVVTTGTCMIPEIIEHGVNGIIANDASDMKFWCRELLQKPDLARKIGEAGRKTIEKRYNLNKFIEKWNSLLYKVIGDFKI